MQNQYYQGQSGSGSIYGPPGQTGSGSIYGPPGQTGGGSLYGAQGQNQSYTQNQYTQPPNQQITHNNINNILQINLVNLWFNNINNLKIWEI